MCPTRYRTLIVTQMKIMQRNLNRSTFVVWEIKRNVSVVRFKFRCNILIIGNIIKEMPGSVASETHCISTATLNSFVLLAATCSYQQYNWKARLRFHDNNRYGNSQMKLIFRIWHNNIVPNFIIIPCNSKYYSKIASLLHNVFILKTGMF